MKKREIFAMICLATIVGLMLLPTEVLASNTSLYGAKEIIKTGKDLKAFFFEAVLPFVGFIFGGYRAFQSLMANHYQAMGIYALLAVSCVFVFPPFLESVFGSSLLLP